MIVQETCCCEANPADFLWAECKSVVTSLVLHMHSLANESLGKLPYDVDFCLPSLHLQSACHKEEETQLPDSNRGDVIAHLICINAGNCYCTCLAGLPEPAYSF